jgi:mono/diheme cytochrome c family protein
VDATAVRNRSMTSRRVAIGLAVLAAGLVFGQTSVFAASAEKGKVAFIKNGCWQCHGERGQGGVTGFKLAPDPIPFETLQNFVRTTSRNMPPYREEILSNDDLADIYAYLQSIPKGPDPKSIPLLNP